MQNENDLIAKAFIKSLTEKAHCQGQHLSTDITLIDVATMLCCNETVLHEDTQSLMECLACAVFDDHSFMDSAIETFKIMSTPRKVTKIINRCYDCIISPTEVVDVFFALPHTNIYYCYSTGHRIDLDNTAEGLAIRAVASDLEWPQNFVFAVRPVSLIIHLNESPHIVNKCLFVTNEMLNSICHERQCVYFRHLLWSWLVKKTVVTTSGRYSCGPIGEKARQIIRRCISERKQLFQNAPKRAKIMGTSNIFDMRAHVLPPCIARQFDLCHIENGDHHPKYPMRMLILSFLFRVYEPDVAFALWKDGFFGENLRKMGRFDESKYGTSAVKDIEKCIDKGRNWGCQYAIKQNLCPFMLPNHSDIITDVECQRIKCGGNSVNNNNTTTNTKDDDIITSCKKMCTCYLQKISNNPLALVKNPISYCYYMGL